MKVTNGDISGAHKALAELAPQKMPVRISLAVLKLRQLLKPFADNVEEMRVKLVHEYGEASPQGLSIPPTILVPDPEHEGRLLPEVNPKHELFMRDFGEVRDVEVVLEFEPIVLSGTVELSPAAVMALEKFITIL